ncbi:MAG: riboflavin synthase [Caulobacterales bacterium]|jgi:riboflavin synthase
MFTGIVTALGTVRAVERRDGLIRWTVEAAYDAHDLAIGASVCHAGVCLTVVEVQSVGPGQARYAVELAPETLALTSLSAVEVGGQVNLERSLKMGDELGGHLVAGHVDGVGEVQSVTPDGEGWRLRIKVPQTLKELIAPKGAITVDGVSLTVNEVEEDVFGLLIIPHTWAVTTLSKLSPGARVNLEADLFARYVARILDARGLNARK